MLPEYALLTRHERCELIEEEHFGLILKCNKNGVVTKIGDDKDYLFSLRSCMKPLQLAAISEIFDAFDFSDKEIAVCSASHTGEDFHIKTILGILAKIGLTEKNLLCPVQNPLSINAQESLIRCNQKPSAIHNNCSGKHAAMLAYCVLKGYNIENYTDINHPLQKKVLNFVSNICDIQIDKTKITRDGCTLPVLAMPLKNLAIGFLNLCNDFPKIVSAILNNPYYFGGQGRLDSELIVAGNKNLVAKVGAGNICCVVDLNEQVAFVIKLSDGDNFSRGLILTKILNDFDKLLDFENSNLYKLFSKNLVDEKNNIVGEIKFCFDSHLL